MIANGIRVKLWYNTDVDEEREFVDTMSEHFINPMPAVPRIGDGIDLPVINQLFEETTLCDFVIGGMDWREDEQGYYVLIRIDAQ